MYYQLLYDKIIDAETFYYKEKNEWLNGLSLYLRFDPIFYVENKQKSKEQMIQLKNERSLLNCLVRVSYDNQTRKLSFHDHEEIKGKYRVAKYYKLVTDEEYSGWCEEEKISKEEFYFLIQHYGQHFHNDFSLQSCSYGWHEIESLPEGTIVQNSYPKHLNETTKRLEEIVFEEKKRHEQLLSVKKGIMKFEYRSECLEFIKRIELLENHKDFLLNKEQFDQEEVMESYVQLYTEWIRFNRFMSQENLYTA